MLPFIRVSDILQKIATRSAPELLLLLLLLFMYGNYYVFFKGKEKGFYVNKYAMRKKIVAFHVWIGLCIRYSFSCYNCNCIK